jgi:hypothetical protein
MPKGIGKDFRIENVSLIIENLFSFKIIKHHASIVLF